MRLGGMEETDSPFETREGEMTSSLIDARRTWLDDKLYIVTTAWSI